MDSKKAIVLEMIQVHKDLLSDFERNGLTSVAQAAKRLIDCIEAGGCIYLCGNGGSAADAQHIAAELVGRFRRDRRGLPAVALTTDTSALTSISNDYGFETIFTRQVEALVRKGDILWAFSTSGTSKNILAAVELARKNGASILAFTGRVASPLEAMADVTICVNGPTSSVQEIHQLAYHILCDLVEEHFVSKES